MIKDSEEDVFINSSKKKAMRLGDKEIDWVDGRKMTVVWMSSECPNCESWNEWTTNGLLPGSFECGKCHRLFNII